MQALTGCSQRVSPNSRNPKWHCIAAMILGNFPVRHRWEHMQLHLWSRCALVDSIVRQAFTEQRHGNSPQRP